MSAFSGAWQLALHYLSRAEACAMNGTARKPISCLLRSSRSLHGPGFTFLTYASTSEH